MDRRWTLKFDAFVLDRRSWSLPSYSSWKDVESGESSVAGKRHGRARFRGREKTQGQLIVGVGALSDGRSKARQ